MPLAEMPRAERTTPLRARTSERIAAAVVATLSLTVLGIAAFLNPSAAGHGTHTGLGLPPCTWAVWFDKPCPTCGMTTAFSHAGEGQWLSSAMTQPFGMILALGTATAFWLSFHQAVFASKVSPMVGWMVRPRPMILLSAGFGAAWVYKIMTWTGS